MANARPRGRKKAVTPAADDKAMPPAKVRRYAWSDFENAQRLEWVEEQHKAREAGELALEDAALLEWLTSAHRSQIPPEGEWEIWLFMGGRGSGKTRAGAEWVLEEVRSGRAKRVALVGPTLGDVREVMIEGPSGLRSVAAEGERPDYEVTRRRLVWPGGAEGFAFSAEDADSLRGPQFDAAWCDEIGAWGRGLATWDMLMFALRLGEKPRVVATTTPRATELVRRLVRNRTGQVAMTQAPTQENAENLAPEFVASIEAAYGGTRLERQELLGELVEDPPGGLWSREVIERGRERGEAGPFERVVVAVDPPAGVDRDACGIVAAGLRERTVFVLADASCRGLRPAEWAGRVVTLAGMHGAGEIVAEANQGGEMVREVLKQAGAEAAGIRVKLRHAFRSKRDRAEPVSVLYEQERVRHAGVFRDLEDEMCAFGADGARSPDRVDALVWAVSELVGRGHAPPRVFSLWRD